eukprot:gene17134-biopygen785
MCWNRFGTPRTATDQRRRNRALGDPGDPWGSGGAAQAPGFPERRSGGLAALAPLRRPQRGAVPRPGPTLALRGRPGVGGRHSGPEFHGQTASALLGKQAYLDRSLLSILVRFLVGQETVFAPRTLPLTSHVIWTWPCTSHRYT